LFGYCVDGVVVNRLLPDDVSDPWFARWKGAQAEHLETITDAFAPVPVLCAELEPVELIGAAELARFGQRLYTATDGPAAVLHHSAPLRVESRGDTLVLSVELPFAARDELDIAVRDGELFLAVGPHRRALALPDSLVRRDVESARLHTSTPYGSTLEVEFVEPLLEAAQ
jgi:arsenite-transporting ATPase